MTKVIAVDTSVAVPLLVASHPSHARVSKAVGRRKVAVVGHAAIETYAVLTRLPGDARLSAHDAITLMTDRFEPHQVSVDSAGAIRSLARSGVVGGAVYDGLVAIGAAQLGDVVLLSRDLRAAATYARVGIEVELIPDPVP